MTHRFASPTEVELENLIAHVYESMPNADQSRLSLIENRLLQRASKNKQKKLNKIPWWIVLILAGSFATAAWWAGDLFIDKQDTEITDQQARASDKISEIRASDNDIESNTENNKQNNETYEDRESQIIYQRESF